MPVNTPHPEYAANQSKWIKFKTIVEGEDAVKDAGTMFLPALGGQEIGGDLNGSASYAGYKLRASFFAATARTVEGIEGVVFRKDPTITFPESRIDFIDNIGKQGAPLHTFAKKVFNSTLIFGRHGAMLDIKMGASATDAPYLVGYDALSILNWRTEFINGKDQLSMVVLSEAVQVPSSDDPFVMNSIEKIRVLRLGTPAGENQTPNSDGGNTGIYYIDIWQKSSGKDATGKNNGYILMETIIPVIRGKRLLEIPFVFFGPKELSASVQKSPIADIAAINASHYRSSADLEHGRHFTALPTAWVAGFPVDTILKIGSTTAWVSENPNANAGFLEFTGQGLGAIETALKDKEGQMAVLGARLLEEPKKAVESADTHLIRKSSEESVTASMARTISAGFTILLKWSAEWMGVASDDVKCELNRDYSSMEISPQMLMALMAALQSGNLSQDTWIYNLQRGEVLPEGRTVEEERDLIAMRPPVPGKDEMDLGNEDGETPEEKKAAEDKKKEEENK